MFKRFLVFCMLICVLATTFCASMSNSAYAAADIDISSKAACLVDFASGDILFSKDETKHLPIASMVKMMTILLTMEEIEDGRLNEETLITTSENAAGMGGSQVFIDPYVEYKAGDLLKSVIIASANDASVALAEHISGSEGVFVDKMNKKAQELDMRDTNYANCTGLPAPEQYSCARDCAIILKEVAKYDLYHKYSTVWMDELIHPSGRKTELVNTNRLVRYYDGCDGGKTGSTNEAGCCLSASAKRGNLRLISVVIGAQNSQTRFNECSKLFNYGFANFECKSVVSLNQTMAEIPVLKGKQDKLELIAAEEFALTAKKGDKSAIQVDIDAPQKIAAPLKQGDLVCKAIVSKDGVVLKEINLIAKTDIEAVSLKDCIDKIAVNW